MKVLIYLFGSSMCRFSIAATLVMSLALSSAQARSFPDIEVIGPSSNPAVPNSFGSFDPPVDPDLVPQTGSPEIYEFSRDNDAGDTVIMTGANFSTYTNRVSSDESDVQSAVLNDSYASTFNLASTWTTDTAIEIECSTYSTPNNYARLFYAEDGKNVASIYYMDGNWVAGDGAGGTITLGAFNTGRHTFRYDSRAGRVSLDNQSYALSGSITDSSTLYMACNSTGYQQYPMALESVKVWRSGVLVEDVQPTVVGTFFDAVSGEEYESKAHEPVRNQPIPFEISAQRNISFSGEEGQDASFMAYGFEVTNFCNIMRLDGGEVAVSLPENLPAGEVYMVWPGNQLGYGTPILLNRAEAWWVGPDKVSPGGKFSVYGRNLGTNCHVYIEELDRWLASDSSNPYKADFTMPSNATQREYTLWAHNTSGGRYGWARPLSCTVEDSFSWSGKIINVKLFGATGDGSSDDWAAVSSAIESASSGDTIYFPAGTYALSYRFSSMSGLKLAGDGMDRTVIKPHPSHTQNGLLFDGLFSDVEISNISFETIENGAGLFRFRGSDTLFDSVGMSSLSVGGTSGYGATPFNFQGTGPRHTFKNCKIINSGNPGNFSVSGGEQVFFDGCDFYGARECSIIIGSWGGQKISVEGCSLQPYDDTETGYFDGRWFVTADYWGAVNNIYFGSNTSSNCAPPKVDGYHANTGEQVLIEGGKFAIRGNVQAATENTVSLPLKPDLSSQLVVTVVAGKGYGQTRKISSINQDTNTITLAEPWRVIPDETSIIVVSATTYRFVVYNNHLDGKEEWASGTSDSASTGVASFGGSVDLIVDSNNMTDLRTGTYHWPLGGLEVDGLRSLQACFFNTFKNNSISNTYMGMKSMIFEADPELLLDGGILAATYRENTLDSINSVGFAFYTSLTEYLIKMSLFERNTFIQCPSSIVDAPYVENQLFVGNRGVNDDNSGVAVSVAYNHLPAFKDNIWSGYAEDYERGPIYLPTENLLEVPQRVVSIEDGVAVNSLHKLPIWNLALSPLTWSASTADDWIILEDRFGTVVDQNDEDFLTFRVDPLSFPNTVGEFSGMIAVVSDDGTQQRNITVFCTNANTVVVTGIAVSAPETMDEMASAQLGCTATFEDGSSANVNPTWSDNSEFAAIDGSGLLSVGHISADQTITVTALFGGFSSSSEIFITNAPPQTYTVSFVSGGNGSLSGNVSQSVLEGGSLASVEAIADDGYQFVRWEGGITSTQNPLVVTGVDSDMQLTAIFSKEGGIVREVWYGIEGVSVNALVGSSRYADSPDQREILTSFESAVNVDDNFGSRIHGYITPTVTGSYTFWIAGDDNCELWLSSDELEDNIELIASVNGWTNVREWDHYSEQESAAVSLQAGRRYYIRALHKEGQYGDHVAVAWEGPGIPRAVISEEYLEPVGTGELVTVSSLTILGQDSLDEQTSGDYECMATYSDGNARLVNPLWSVAGSGTIDSAGAFLAGNVESDATATITAGFGGQTRTYMVTVKYVAPVVNSIMISGPDMVVEEGEYPYQCVAIYSDGSSNVVQSSSWSVWNEQYGSSDYATIGSDGLLSVATLPDDSEVVISVGVGEFVGTLDVKLIPAGDRVIYPLDGFEGVTIRADLYDNANQELRDLGEFASPREIIINNLSPGVWYWLTIKQYDEVYDDWIPVQENWISM